MNESPGTELAESKALQRTTHVVAEVTARLRTLGLYGINCDFNGRHSRVDISDTHRRELLVFLSELEEAVKSMQSFADELASDIARYNQGQSAAAAYRQSGRAYRQNARRSAH